MSSLTARMAKRFLKGIGFKRERLPIEGSPKWRPGVVLDDEGTAYATTWSQAAAKLSKSRPKK